MEDISGAPGGAPKHAHLWLTADQMEEWLSSKQQVPYTIAASFLAFNLLSALSLRILNRKGTVKHPKNMALLQIGATSATHAVISLMAAVYLLVRRDLSHCGQQAFCHDDLSARLMDMHAGYWLYEVLFWQKASAVAAPWTEMLFLHNVVAFLGVAISRMYPCRLSLLLLPYYQSLQLATIADCARRVCAIYGAPWHLRFRTQLAMLLTHAAKLLGAAALAAYTYMWIREHSVWTLELPEGMSVLNHVYGMIFMAGSIITALIYVKWFGAALEMTNSVVEAAQRQRGDSGSAAQAAAKTLVRGGKGRSSSSNGKKPQRDRR